MEKHYSIDPGQGEKMDGCPYSTFEDGHDVKDFIIPPKGYDFVGFKFEPLPNNRIYDGKLVAQYEKAALKDRIVANIWHILIPLFIVLVIGVAAWLLTGVFKNSEPASSNPKPQKTNPEVIATPSDSIIEKVDNENKPVAENVSQPIKDENKPVTENVSQPIEDENEVLLDLTKKFNQQNEGQAVEEEKTPAPSQSEALDPNAQFQQEFWDLIHRGVYKMNPYHELYTKNKNKVDVEEYDYLRFTIIKNSKSFREWNGKLSQIPDSERENINSVNELVRRLNEIE